MSDNAERIANPKVYQAADPRNKRLELEHDVKPAVSPGAMPPQPASTQHVHSERLEKQKQLQQELRDLQDEEARIATEIKTLKAITAESIQERVDSILDSDECKPFFELMVTRENFRHILHLMNTYPEIGHPDDYLVLGHADKSLRGLHDDVESIFRGLDSAAANPVDGWLASLLRLPESNKAREMFLQGIYKRIVSAEDPLLKYLPGQ